MDSSRYGTMVEDYLKVIWKAQEWADQSITTSEIAATLGVAPSSVSGNLKKLARDGLIEYEPYGRIDLSPAGRAVAVGVVRRHRIIETYLVERLGFGWDEVHHEADMLEHAVSDLLLERLDTELGHPTADPHGDPIPAADGTVHLAPSVPLGDVGAETAGTVVRISDDDPAILRYVTDRGIRIGSRIVVVERFDAAGSMRVRVGNEPAVEIPLPSAHTIRVDIR